MLGSLSTRQGLFGQAMYMPILAHIDYNSPLYTQHFSLTYGHTCQNDTFDISITTDGLQYVWFLEASKTGTTRNTVIGVATSSTSLRPYMFSRLQLTGTFPP